MAIYVYIKLWFCDVLTRKRVPCHLEAVVALAEIARNQKIKINLQVEWSAFPLAAQALKVVPFPGLRAERDI